MTRLTELDWQRIEAARQNAHYLRSEVAHDIAIAIRDGIRKAFTAEDLPKDGGVSAART